MANFGSMKTWVSKRLQDPSNTAVSASDVGDLINQAIDYWKVRRFWFNEVTDTTTLSESDASIPLPSDFLCPSVDNGAFVIEYSGIRYPLKKVSETAYNEMYLSNGIGRPMWYSRQASQEYQVYPIPDRDYTLRRFYLKDYDALSGDDTNDWTDYATDLIQYTALAYGTRDFRQDMAMYREFMTEAQDEYQKALVRTTKDNSTGSLEVGSCLLAY